MTKSQIFGKWTLLVWLNAAFSVVMAVSSGFKNIEDILGIICGVFTFIALYSFIDFRLQQQNKKSLRRWLLIGVIIQIVTQLLPWLQIMTGVLAMNCIKYFSLSGERIIRHKTSIDSFFTTYFTTILDGIFLSIVLGVLVLIIKLIATKLLPLLKTKETTS